MQGLIKTTIFFRQIYFPLIIFRSVNRVIIGKMKVKTMFGFQEYEEKKKKENKKLI